VKLLKDILYAVGLRAVSGSTNVIVNEIHFDSRNVKMDDVFIAVRGTITEQKQLFVKNFQSSWSMKLPMLKFMIRTRHWL